MGLLLGFTAEPFDMCLIIFPLLHMANGRVLYSASDWIALSKEVSVDAD
jgi:hypothetical protein